MSRAPGSKGQFRVPDAIFAIPGDIESPTGGYTYDRHVLALLPGQGVHVRHLPLPGSFPHPSADDIAATVHALADVPTGVALLFDGLAYSALPADILRNIRQPVVAIVHHPLSFEPGLADDQRRALYASERAALSFAKAIVVSSRTTRMALADDFGVPSDRITIAEPGTIRAPRARGSGGDPSILTVGSISPRKGYDVLIEALHRVSDRPWRATVAGSSTRDPTTATALTARIMSRDLINRITLAGEVDDARLAALYDRADLFVLSSFYEGYGMVLSEAMARGLPIVSTTGGAAAETVPDGAALKVPPGDAAALATAIGRMLDDPGLRNRIADASWRAGQTLPGWDQTAAIIARVLRAAA
jgi:glycosyltransferase involved in cell wall biosynthesis